MATVTDLILSTAQSVGVDPALAYEVAWQESNLNQNAVSPTGAIGIFQLEPATAADLGVDPRDLQQNIFGGITYLKQLLNSFGDTATALAAYNWGMGHVRAAMTQFGSDWLSYAPAETQNYVATILSNLGQWSASITPSGIAAGVTTAAGDTATALATTPGWQTALVAAIVALGIWLLAEEFA